jgi:superfamily II DNA or RNA helicase
MAEITNKNFYGYIKKTYSKFTIDSKKKSLRDICFPQKYEFQIPQKFLAEFINPDTPYKGLLVYHRIGAGKTCTAINIAENFKGKTNILVVLPASLKGNFRSELRSQCAGQSYLSNADRDKLSSLDPTDPAYKAIIAKSDAKIDKVYRILSYNKFVELLKADAINFNNTLLIIDEIHNMVSETGSYYEELYDAIQSAPSTLRLVLMSATPIFDKPGEIALTMNLLIRDPKLQLPTGKDFSKKFIKQKVRSDGGLDLEIKNKDLFKKSIKGYISYYRGAPPHVFPKVEYKLVKVTMSDHQYETYAAIEKAEYEKYNKNSLDYLDSNISNSFYIGTRMASNIVYPNGQIGEEGYESLTDDDLSMLSMRTFSPKFAKILRAINKCEGTVFVYSNFKEYGGIRAFARFLEHQRYKNYEFNGVGRKRYAIWSGDTSADLKDEIKAIFNRKENQDGSKIKVVLGSSAIKEGVSFLRVQEVHIMEPYWNFSRLDQVMGRAIRFCSHKDVELEKRLVKVFVYVAVYPPLSKETKKSISPVSVDARIMEIALSKRYINGEFELAMKEAAIDCNLFKNANEPNIVCET